MLKFWSPWQLCNTRHHHNTHKSTHNYFLFPCLLHSSLIVSFGQNWHWGQEIHGCVLGAKSLIPYRHFKNLMKLHLSVHGLSISIWEMKSPAHYPPLHDRSIAVKENTLTLILNDATETQVPIARIQWKVQLLPLKTAFNIWWKGDETIIAMSYLGEKHAACLMHS